MLCRLTHFKWKMKACMTKWDHDSIIFCSLICWKQSILFFILPASSQLQLAEERSDDGDAKSMNMEREVFSLIKWILDSDTTWLNHTVHFFSFYLQDWIYASMFCLNSTWRSMLGYDINMHIYNFVKINVIIWNLFDMYIIALVLF